MIFLMTDADLTASFNLLQIRNFFDAETREKILSEMRSAQCAPATVYGSSGPGTVNERMRRTTRLQPSQQTIEFVDRMLLERKPIIEEHFQTTITDCEDAQFLRYDVGDFFVAHQDGNTGMMKSSREQSRKVSVTIFLNDQSDDPETGTYSGGTLIFHRYDFTGSNGDLHLPLKGESGTLVAFRPETTHEVIPVTRGERYSIVCWYR